MLARPLAAIIALKSSIVDSVLWRDRIGDRRDELMTNKRIFGFTASRCYDIVQ